MTFIRLFVSVLILFSSGIHSRVIRQRRQSSTYSIGHDINNFISTGYNTIRDTVVPALNSVTNQLSQNWDQYKPNFYQGFGQLAQTWDHYKQNFNQGANQIAQNWNRYGQNFNTAWNQFSQNYIPQYPYNNNNDNNVGFNQLGYNTQHNPYPSYFSSRPTQYQGFNRGQQNPYSPNNYLNWRGVAQEHVPYNTGSLGQSWYQSRDERQRLAGGQLFNVDVDMRPRLKRRK